MLTPLGRTLARASAVFLLAGLIFGNLPIIGVGALLFVFLAAAMPPRPPVVSRMVDRTRIARGGYFTLHLRIELQRGVGLVEIHQALPDEFELLEGNNLHALAMGWKPRVETFEVRVRAPKRGEFTLPAPAVRAVHPLGISEARVDLVGDPETLFVEPRPIPARMPRHLRAAARAGIPEGDRARSGLSADEFKELRTYVPGDPPRRINWKATARVIAAGTVDAPLVNEMEPEGRKRVWLLVDGHPRLSVGTNLADSREHAADAALSLAEAYLDRGHSVAMSLARSGSLPPVRYGTGEAHVARLRRMLARLGPATHPSLVDVLARDRALAVRGAPLVILVTRFGGEDTDLLDAFAKLGALPARRAVTPALVVDVAEPSEATSDPAAEAASVVVEARRARQTRAARAARLRVLTWRPHAEPLLSVLVEATRA